MGRIRYYFREAWRGIWHHRALTANSLFALTGALIVPAVFLVILVNALGTLESVEGRREMVIFLEDEVADSTLIEITARFEGIADTVVYVSPEEAWDEMARELGDSELLEAVGENPLPASLRVWMLPGYRDYESMDSIAVSLNGNQAVDEIRFGARGLRVMDRAVATLTWVGLGLGVLIGVVVLFLVANTIRLTVIARREIHRVMTLMGASGIFIRVPLLLEALLVCLMAALFSLGVVFALFLAIERRLPVLPEFLPWEWMAAFVAASGVLGLLGGLLALTGGREKAK